MRRIATGLTLLAALACANCSNLGSTLNIVGTDLGIIAADLPTACGNVAAALTVAAALSASNPSLASSLSTAQADINKYCGPAATTVADVGAAIGVLQGDAAALTAAGQ